MSAHPISSIRLIQVPDPTSSAGPSSLHAPCLPWPGTEVQGDKAVHDSKTSPAFTGKQPVKLADKTITPLPPWHPSEWARTQARNAMGAQVQEG